MGRTHSDARIYLALSAVSPFSANDGGILVVAPNIVTVPSGSSVAFNEQSVVEKDDMHLKGNAVEIKKTGWYQFSFSVSALLPQVIEVVETLGSSGPLTLAWHRSSLYFLDQFMVLP